MSLIFLLKGFFIGFSIAAPVGPIGVLCIRRTLSHGWWSGFVSGLGAATADTFYMSVAAFGLTVVTNFLVGQQFWLQVGGGIFLLFLGLKIFRTKAVQEELMAPANTRIKDFISTFFLTLSNPITILAFLAIFAGVGIGRNLTHMSALLMVMGTFLGALSWWMILTSGVNLLRSRFTLKSLTTVNKISGVIVLVFGLGIIIESFVHIPFLPAF